MRFGIAHELYAYEQNWVQLDGDGRNAKPLEDPGVVYARRFGPTNGAPLVDDAGTHTNGSSAPDPLPPAASGRSGSAKRVRQTAAASAAEVQQESSDAAEGTGLPACPKCGGRVWDNRLSKRNPKAPDYKCRDRACDGVIWPPRTTGTTTTTSRPASGDLAGSAADQLDSSPLGLSVDDIPF